MSGKENSRVCVMASNRIIRMDLEKFTRVPLDIGGDLNVTAVTVSSSVVELDGIYTKQRNA